MFGLSWGFSRSLLLIWLSSKKRGAFVVAVTIATAAHPFGVGVVVAWLHPSPKYYISFALVRAQKIEILQRKSAVFLCKFFRVIWSENYFVRI